MKKIILLIALVMITIIVVVAIYLTRLQRKNYTPLNSASQETNNSQELSEPNIKIELVAEKLNTPWSMVFTSNNRILVAERPGNIRVILGGKLQAQPLYEFTDVAAVSESGLMGLVLDPDYLTNKYLYASYSYKNTGKMLVKIVRLIDVETSLKLDKVILDNLPAAQNHAGTRLARGPDNKLYVTTGDATNRSTAQDYTSLNGKILRMNFDGSIPSDNPDPKSLIFALGLRNSQGIAWDKSGNLYAVDHGPSVFDGPPGGDEINRIVPNGNYGWPLVSHNATKPGLISPMIQFTPAVAPSSLMIYSDKVFPQFEDNLFFGGLRGTGLYRVIIDKDVPDKVLRYENISGEKYGRIRVVAQSPDGFIYFATSNRDGRGRPDTSDDRIFRIVPGN